MLYQLISAALVTIAAQSAANILVSYQLRTGARRSKCLRTTGKDDVSSDQFFWFYDHISLSQQVPNKIDRFNVITVSS